MKKEVYARYNEEKKAEAWTKTAKTVKEYSEEMVDQWNKEIDALLTFVSHLKCYPLFWSSDRSIGRSVLGNTHCIQRRVLQTTPPTRK